MECSAANITKYDVTTRWFLICYRISHEACQLHNTHVFVAWISGINSASSNIKSLSVFSHCNQNSGHIPWKHMSQSAWIRRKVCFLKLCLQPQHTFYIFLPSYMVGNNCWPIFFSSSSNQHILLCPIRSRSRSKTCHLPLPRLPNIMNLEPTSTSWTWSRGPHIPPTNFHIPPAPLIPPLMTRNPYYRNWVWWVYPLLYTNNGSWSTLALMKSATACHIPTKQQQLHARRKRHRRWDLDELDLGV